MPRHAIFPHHERLEQARGPAAARADFEKLKKTIGLSAYLHPDFSDADADGYGIPYQVVDSSTPTSPVSFTWPNESDAGPYPIPDAPLIENASDRHLLMLDKDACKLYELYAARKQNGA